MGMFWLTWSQELSVWKKTIAAVHPKGTFTTLKVLFSPCSISIHCRGGWSASTTPFAEEIPVGVFSTLLLAEGGECGGFENCERDMEGEIGEKSTNVKPKNPHS